MFDIFFQAIIWLAVATAWAFLGMLIDAAEDVRIWVLYGMLWLVVLASMRVYRCVWILRRVTTLVIEQGDANQP